MAEDTGWLLAIDGGDWGLYAMINVEEIFLATV